MDPVWFLVRFHGHSVELVQSLLALIYGRLWESASRIMKVVTLWFTIVLQEERYFARHLEVGPFPYNFIFSSITGPFLRSDEEIVRSREVLDLFKSKIVKFTFVVFQVQDDGAYPLGIDDTPNAIDFRIITFF